VNPDWGIIFFVFAKEFGWTPNEVGRLTITQALAMSHYLADHADQMKAASEGKTTEGGEDAANRRAKERLVMKHGLRADRIFDATTASGTEVKKRFGGGKTFGG